MLPDAAPRVFLSYARRDGEEFATALRRRLTADEPGLTIWQDRAQMEGGIGWWRQIEAALDRVQFLVVVMTPHAFESEVTRAEWRYARHRGVHVYPVKGVPRRVAVHRELMPERENVRRELEPRADREERG